MRARGARRVPRATARDHIQCCPGSGRNPATRPRSGQNPDSGSADASLYVPRSDNDSCIEVRSLPVPEAFDCGLRPELDKPSSWNSRLDFAAPISSSRRAALVLEARVSSSPKRRSRPRRAPMSSAVRHGPRDDQISLIDLGPVDGRASACISSHGPCARQPRAHGRDPVSGAGVDNRIVELVPPGLICERSGAAKGRETARSDNILRSLGVLDTTRYLCWFVFSLHRGARIRICKHLK